MLSVAFFFLEIIMDYFLNALRQYLYGIGWLVICITFCITSFKLFDKFTPVDFKKELEEKNIAFALFVGLFLFGLALGTLIFAGMSS